MIITINTTIHFFHIFITTKYYANNTKKRPNKWSIILFFYLCYILSVIIFFNNSIFKHFSCLTINWMCYITIFPIS